MVVIFGYRLSALSVSNSRPH